MRITDKIFSLNIFFKSDLGETLTSKFSEISLVIRKEKAHARAIERTSFKKQNNEEGVL